MVIELEELILSPQHNTIFSNYRNVSKITMEPYGYTFLFKVYYDNGNIVNWYSNAFVAKQK